MSTQVKKRIPSGSLSLSDCPDRIHRIVELVPHNMVAITSEDDKIRIYSMEDGNQVHVIVNAHDKYVKDIVSVDEHHFISVGGDFMAKLWCISDWTVLSEVELPDWGLSIESIGTCRFIIGTGITGRLVEVATLDAELLHVRTVSTDSTWIDHISVYANRFVTTSMRGSIYVWDTENLRVIKTIDDHQSWVHSAELRDDMLVTGGDDQTIRVYKGDVFDKTCVFEADENLPLCIKLVNDNNHLLCAGTREIFLLDLKTSTVSWTLEAKESFNWIEVLTGNKVAIGASNGGGVSIVEMNQLEIYK